MRHLTAWLNAGLVFGVVMALTLGAANNLGTLDTSATPPPDNAGGLWHHISGPIIAAALVWLALGVIGALTFVAGERRRRHPYRWHCQRCPYSTSGTDPIVVAQDSLKHSRGHHDHQPAA